MNKENTIGTVEKVRINGEEFLARIDTGAKRTSIDESLVKRFGLKKLRQEVVVKNAQGTCKRQLVRVRFELKNKVINSIANVANRSGMKYKILIGRDDLKPFLIKVTK